MDFQITVWRMRSRNGLDHARVGEKYPIVNTIAIRYPNVNRVKGEPHEIEKCYDVPCIPFWDDNAINHVNQLGAHSHKPNLDKIDRIVNRYKRIGDVQVIWNFNRN